MKPHPFDISISRQADNDPDLSYLGTYTDKPSFPFYDRLEGVIIHNHDEWEALDVENRPRSREYRYIHHFQCPDDAAIEQDARRLEDYGNGWSMEAIIVSASLDGKEFGSAALGGIESDSSEAYFKEIEKNLTEEAATMATKEFHEFMTKHRGTP